jgi:hypothetical protein
MCDEQHCFSTTGTCLEIFHRIFFCSGSTSENYSSNHTHSRKKNVPSYRRRTVIFEEDHNMESVLKKIFPYDEYHYSPSSHYVKPQPITFVGGNTKYGRRISTTS